MNTKVTLRSKCFLNSSDFIFRGVGDKTDEMLQLFFYSSGEYIKRDGFEDINSESGPAH